MLWAGCVVIPVRETGCPRVWPAAAIGTPRGKAKLRPYRNVLALSRRGDRRLKTEAKIPGEIDPGVLRHLGDEGIDERTAERLCIDRRDMRLGQYRANEFDRRARIGEIIDDEQAFAAAAHGLRQNAFQDFRFALGFLANIADDAKRFDDPHIELARDN